MARPKSVSVNEFETFKQDIEATQNKILDLLEESLKPKPSSGVSVNADVSQAIKDTKAELAVDNTGGPIEGFLPPQYQKIFEKYFDPADGFEAHLNFPEMDEKGSEMGGITFTIIVPQKFSNASDAHRKFYKTDVRMIALRPENIVRGIDKWCGRVAKNLKYNKLIKTK